MNIVMGFVFTAFLALAMTIENMASADDALLLPGTSLTVVCSDGGVPVVTPRSPPFAAPVPCDPPNPRIGMTGKLIGGTHTYALSGGATTVLRFFSGQDVDSIDIDWRPAPGSFPDAVAVSISRCSGDFDVDFLPRRCFSGSKQGHLAMTSFKATDEECQLTHLAQYSVNLSAINILAGRPSCGIGDPCEVELTVTLNRLED